MKNAFFERSSQPRAFFERSSQPGAGGVWGAEPPGPPSTRLGRPLKKRTGLGRPPKKRTGLGRPLKKIIFQTWPQNLYNQAAQVESFNFIPISSKMVKVMMVYERPANSLNLAPVFIVKMSVSGF